MTEILGEAHKEKKTQLILGDDRIVYHVGKELPEKGSDFLMVSGKAHAQGYGVYCGDKPDLRYVGGEQFKEKIDRTPIYCLPLHGIWRAGTSKKGYPTFHTEGRSVYLQDIQYVDVDIPVSKLKETAYMQDGLNDTQIQKLRYYFSLHPVFFNEPSEFHLGNFAENYRNGKMKFEDIIHNLMREDGKYEDRIDEQIVRQQLEKAVKLGYIPTELSILNTINSTPLDNRIWIGPQEKDLQRDYTKLVTPNKRLINIT